MEPWGGDGLARTGQDGLDWPGLDWDGLSRKICPGLTGLDWPGWTVLVRIDWTGLARIDWTVQDKHCSHCIKDSNMLYVLALLWDLAPQNYTETI